MFEHAVTKTYEMKDASLELLIMLAGAFLLGCLFCWALGSRKRKRNVKEV
ncbi:hypothetical protein [Leucothrix mucor]|jgi:hypothetical protein|nr:hypothetical protein [Leucothrix mucor]